MPEPPTGGRGRSAAPLLPADTAGPAGGSYGSRTNAETDRHGAAETFVPETQAGIIREKQDGPAKTALIRQVVPRAAAHLSVRLPRRLWPRDGTGLPRPARRRATRSGQDGTAAAVVG